jgi:REP element-mobilizing transposase RayT
MPTGYQIKDQTSAYYLTFQIVYWIDLFTRNRYREIIIDSLKFCQQNKSLEIFAFVIMSNHVHLIARSNNDNLSDVIRDFKKYTSKQFIDEIDSSIESRKKWMLNLFQHAAKKQNKNGSYQVWTHENHAIEVFSNSVIWQKANYIHDNPVRNKLVENSWDYLYSSARNYADMEGVLEITKLSVH